MYFRLFSGCEAARLPPEDAGAARRARRRPTPHQEQSDLRSPRQVRLPHSPHNQIEAERRGKWQKLLLRINGEWNLTDSKNQDKDILMSHFGPLFIVVFSLMFAIASIRNCIEKVIQTKRSIIEVVLST